MTKLRIVEVEGGKFAMQEREFLQLKYRFIDRNDGFVWLGSGNIRRYCLFESLPQAEDAFESVLSLLRANAKNAPKVVKIIKVEKL